MHRLLCIQAKEKREEAEKKRRSTVASLNLASSFESKDAEKMEEERMLLEVERIQRGKALFEEKSNDQTLAEVCAGNDPASL
jgi:hypothetical protein